MADDISDVDSNDQGCFTRAVTGRLDNLAKRVVGGSIEPQLRVLLASVGADFAGLTVFVMYFGPWLVQQRHSSATFISLAFIVAGVAGMVGGFVGGRLSDRYGRRPVILFGAWTQAVASVGMLLPVNRWTAAALFSIVIAAQPLRGVGQRALLADLTNTETREKAFADYRLTLNLGLFGGPVVAAALVAWSWWLAYCGAAILLAASLVLAYRSADVPARARYASSRSRLTLDPRLITLFIASTAAWTVVNAYEIVVPTILVGGAHLSPQAWGLIYALGPVMVVVFQLRVQRWTGRLSARTRLVAGLILMGSAFLLLVRDTSALSVALVTIVFLTGDMVWGPASEAAVVRIAPPDRRGAYMGAMAASIWLGSALAPAIGVQVQKASGDRAVWPVIGGLALLASVLYVLAELVARRHTELSGPSSSAPFDARSSGR